MEDIREALKGCGELDEKGKRRIAGRYIDISNTVSRGKKSIDMPGELLEAKMKPPKRSFRMRAAYA